MVPDHTVANDELIAMFAPYASSSGSSLSADGRNAS
jgi:hypothetical protein